MSEVIQPNGDDVVVTDQLRVVCDGPVHGRHPRVYLTMVDDEDGVPTSVTCPYCSKVFKYRGGSTPS